MQSTMGARATIQRRIGDLWRRSRQWRRRRWLLGLAGIGLLVVGVVAAAAWVGLHSAHGDLSNARDHLADAESHARDQDVDAAIASISLAEQELSAAQDTLQSNVAIDLAHLVPVARQNIDAARILVDRVSVITAGVRQLADSAEPVTEAGLIGEEGVTDVEAFDELQSQIRTVRNTLSSLGPIKLPSRWVLDGRIEQAAEELAERETDLRQMLASLDDATTLVDEITGLHGHRRWLIVVANAAEMRGAGGMPLSYVVLGAVDGEMSFGEVGTDTEINRASAEPVEVTMPEDFRARYSPDFRIRHDFRNATISGDFTVGAPVLQAMYERASGTRIDGVIQVDSMGLAHLLDRSGAIRVDGVGRLDADNVVDVTLNELYDDVESVDERHDIQAEIAAAAIDHLLDSGVEPLDAVESLAAAVDERHLMVYASDDDVQAAVERLGASGRIPAGPGSFHLAVENFAGNKLDYYIDTGLELAGDWTTDRRLTATVSVTNAAPNRTEPRYIFGPHNDTLRAGQYRAHVILYLPAGATVPSAPSESVADEFQVTTEAGRPVVTFALDDVPAGETATVEIGVELPESDRCPELDVTPQPRIRSTTAEIEVATPDGDLTYDGRVEKRISVAADC